MQISARNQLRGTVIGVDHGVTTSHVRIDVGNNTYVTASITKESAVELQLEPGKEVTAIIKASDVMVAVD